MSGVFGFHNSASDYDLSTLSDQMARSMCHNDWHVAQGLYDSQNKYALGRIGIGILNKAQQPVWSADRSVGLVMAGEFYDAFDADLTESLSDEDRALALYLQYGEMFVKNVNGAFVIAIIDLKKNRLLILNDRFGLYPTYYSQVGNWFIFAPEVKAILKVGGIPRTLRDDSIAEYMVFQRLLGQKTFFTNVFLLPPASILSCDLRVMTTQVKTYWDFKMISQAPASIKFDEAVEEGGRLFQAAVEKMSAGSEKIGVFLSGGLDSRAILGFIPPRETNIHTFTFGQPGCRDEYYARKIAAVSGADHHFFPYENGKWIIEYVDRHVNLTEGFQPWIHMHGMNMLNLVRESVDVNISGLGDLLWLQPNFVPRSLAYAPDDIAFNSLFYDLYNQKYSWPGITYAEERYLYHADFYPRIQGLAFDSFVNEVSQYSDLDYSLRASAFNLNNHFNRHLLNSAVCGRSWVEYRLPYFDLDLLSFCYSLPYELGYDRKLQKGIIAKKLPKLARIATDADELPISEDFQRTFIYLLNKFKSGVNNFVKPLFPSRSTLYADYEGWLRTDLRPWAEDILYDQRTADRRIFRTEAVHSLMNRECSGKQEWLIGKIAPIITFEMMLRKYYD